MSLFEFCDLFNSRLIQSAGEEIDHLRLSRRQAYKADGSFFYPLSLKSFVNVTAANPKAKNHWFYCKAMCMSFIPCKTINELLPSSDDDTYEKVQEHWVNKYIEAFSNKTELLPKWARICHKKYYEPVETPSASESESDNGVETDNEEQNNGDVISDCNSEAEDVDDDFRATRARNTFYQNLEDQVLFRQIEESGDLDDQDPRLKNMSNPRGKISKVGLRGMS